MASAEAETSSDEQVLPGAWYMTASSPTATPPTNS